MATIKTGPRSQLARVLGIDCVQLLCGFLKHGVSDAGNLFSDTTRNIAMLGDRGLSNSDICLSFQGLPEHIQAAVMPEINTTINQSMIQRLLAPSATATRTSSKYLDTCMYLASSNSQCAVKSILIYHAYTPRKHWTIHPCSS
jgi:hypothetical protein